MIFKWSIPRGGFPLKIRHLVIVPLLLLLALSAFLYWRKGQSPTKVLFYSGTIEATEANLAFQVAGRVTRVFVKEGMAVKRGDPLAELERREFEARVDAVRAELGRLQTLRTQLQTNFTLLSKTLPLEVARAEANVAALKSQLRELEAGNRPQEVERARQAMLAGVAVLEEAKKDNLRYEQLFKKGLVSEKEWDTARLKYETALRDYEQRKETYEVLKEGSRQEQIEMARARLREGELALNVARSNLKRLDMAALEVEAIRRQEEAARAELIQREEQLSQTRLTAPFDGIITTRSIEPGEVVTPNRYVFSLADLNRVELKIFVEETTIGRIKPGQRAEVTVDTFPGKVYHGFVSYISPEAEFTPKYIQTRKERVNLVYLVKITVPNPQKELKPGMPADARLE